MGIGPVFAIPKLLKRAGLKIEDIGLWELNEAFAVQVIYCRDKLGIPNERLNVDGGAGFDADDERDPQVIEQRKQGDVGKTPIGGDDDAALAHGLRHAAHGPADHRQFIALHAPF
jgi:hypothetical protein